jgi:hypothetical protein
MEGSVELLCIRVHEGASVTDQRFAQIQGKGKVVTSLYLILQDLRESGRSILHTGVT